MLLIDDDEDLCLLLEDILTLSGFRVLVASTAAQARQALELATPLAVVCELQLGGQPFGFGLATTVRERPDPHPLLVLHTAWVRTGMEEVALTAGFDVVLFKPAEPAALVGLLQRATH